MKYKFNEEEQEQLDKYWRDNKAGIYAFENYCGSCYKFETDECPFRDKVLRDTYYKDLGCKEFID